jgi:hypothetical protein
MSEPAGRLEHPGVIAAPPHLEIGPTGQGCLDPDPNLPGPKRALGDITDL